MNTARMWKLQKWRTSRSLYRCSSLLCPSIMLNEIQVMDLQHGCSHSMCLLAKTIPALLLKGQCLKIIMRSQSLQEHFTHEQFPNYAQLLRLPSLFMTAWTSSKDQLASPFSPQCAQRLHYGWLQRKIYFRRYAAKLHTWTFLSIHSSRAYKVDSREWIPQNVFLKLPTQEK